MPTIKVSNQMINSYSVRSLCPGSPFHYARRDDYIKYSTRRYCDECQNFTCRCNKKHCFPCCYIL